MEKHRKWQSLWYSQQVPFYTEIADLSHRSVEGRFHCRLSGSSVRLHFTNKGNTGPLAVREAVFMRERHGAEAEAYTVTVGGAENFAIPEGASFYSDALDLLVSAGDTLVLKIFFDSPTRVSAVSMTWSRENWTACCGDGASYRFLGDDPYEKTAIPAVDHIDILPDTAVKAVSCFGDSLTAMGYYTDALSAMAGGSAAFTVRNNGINGNRLLYGAPDCPELPGAGRCFGEAGRSRFFADVYGGGTDDLPDPDIVFVLIGANDCRLGFAPGAAREIPAASELEDAVKAIAETVHTRGGRILVGTVPPIYLADDTVRNKCDEIRQGFNAWIRSSGEIDAFADIDRAVRDPEYPVRTRADLCLADHVHFNKEGGAAAAQCIIEKLNDLF